MGDNLLTFPALIVGIIMMAVVLIVSSIELIRGEYPTEEQIEQEVQQKQVVQQKKAAGTEQIGQIFKQVEKTLIASNVIMTVVSVLGVISGVKLCMVYKSLKNSEENSLKHL